MRSVKFRVWDIKNKKYDAHIGHNLFYTDENHIGFEDIIEYAHGEKRYILEQHTGKTDREGVKIFEGDIVFHEKCGYGIVYFDREYMCFDIKDAEGRNDNRLFYSKFVKGFISVKGNILENKELLNK